MTLFRQIAINISVVFFLLLGVLLLNNLHQSNHFIQGQMQTAANDMATTLGITIANGIDTDDKAAIDTLFNTVFDSGYYSRIALLSLDGIPIAEKEQSVRVRNVPEWFQSLVRIEPASGSTQVMKGWIHFGELRVTLHPGYAYVQLYEAFSGMLLWFTILGGISLAALWWLLRWFMQPLKRVQEQAEAIHENRFIRQETLPRTRELRHVVSAMNRMVDKVKSIVEEQSNTLRCYHELLYVDDATKLGNRRYLLMRLEELLQDDSSSRGTLVMFAIQGLEQIHQRHGYQATVQRLQSLAQVMERNLPKTHTFSARLNGSEFAVYLDTSMENSEAYVYTVFSDFRSLYAENEFGINAGLVNIGEQQTIGGILGRADYALTQAIAKGTYHIQHHAVEGDHIPSGKTQWRSWLEESLEARRFFVVGQIVNRPNQTLLHRELFIRLKDKHGKAVPAGRFLPIAASLGMESHIDREVYRVVIENAASQGPVAINLSHAVLSTAEALADFEHFVQQYREHDGGVLFVEISHFALTRYPDVARHIADLVHSSGYYFGIDHFDLGGDIASLGEVRPYYIKIDARQLDDITADGTPGAFQPLRTLASSLDIELIAVGVDSAELKQRLQALGSIGLQGNYLEEPKELA